MAGGVSVGFRLSTGVLGEVLAGVLAGWRGFFEGGSLKGCLERGLFYLGKGGWSSRGFPLLDSALSCVGRESCYTFVSLTWYISMDSVGPMRLRGV